MQDTSGICTIIAAKNAADTIKAAIISALAETEVSEVVVVDDGSSDQTADVARSADDGSGRLTVVKFDQNRGPSAARNHAISISRAPLIAILDADDFFFPGRFAPMLAQDDWDFVADNIAFVDANEVGRAATLRDRFPPKPVFLDLKGFVDGNISKPGVRRGEIGFLKPVMRRSFMKKHGLRYREEMRLGEDYELYVRALARGGRYKVIHSCGYGAVVRGNSLSGSHKTVDLLRLYEADCAILAEGGLNAEDIAAVKRHAAHIKDKYELRHFLDVKREKGMAGALAHVAGRPLAAPGIAAGIFRDKTERLRNPGGVEVATRGAGGLRYLLPVPTDA
ncbi:glycosyltransferase family 2 protein [Oryzifoliimicrobium ureilyticus]|uniref:glycosyltransferase family 2 protein n=1 Tax=Oryzifoliimicrobium ureilyticus TaxID=3113724 RepID=UPI0030764A15